MVEICEYCGWENQNNTNFCSSCGRPLKTGKHGKEEKEVSINYKKLIIVSYIIAIGFSWGGLIFNILINRFGVGFLVL